MSYYEAYDVAMRPVTPSDLGFLAEHRNSFDTWPNLTSKLPIYQQDKWFESLGEDSLYFIGINEDSKPILAGNNGPQLGIVQLEEKIAFLRITDIDYVNSNAAIGLDIFAAHRGQGWGRKYFSMLVKFAFQELGFHRLWLLVKEGNFPAMRIYLDAGFQSEGTMREHLYRDGKYENYHLMGLLRKDWHE